MLFVTHKVINYKVNNLVNFNGVEFAYCKVKIEVFTPFVFRKVFGEFLFKFYNFCQLKFILS